MRKVYRTRVLEAEIPFSGGLDTITPQRYVQPGVCQAARNIYQDINDGYVTTLCYERFDGRPKPSDAQYYILPCSTILSVQVGDTITDDGTASGVVIAIDTDFLVLTKLVNDFIAGSIYVSAVPQGTCTGPQQVNAASTAKEDAQFQVLAADVYRNDIQAVPGNGAIRGVFAYKDIVYAFRDTGAEGRMYKSTSTGWTQVDLGGALAFTSGGTYVPQEGDTITDGTQTAVIGRVILTSGTWAAGDAAGTIYIHSQTGAFTPGNLDIGPNANVLTIAADTVATVLIGGGKYDFALGNFTGATATFRVYGCDGVNKGFEWDGTIYIPITTGMPNDRPDLVFIHKYQLFFTFEASLQHSEPGDPYDWNTVVGAGELALGDKITSLISLPGDFETAALAVYSRNSFAVLYGDNSSNWRLREYKQGMGAIEWTGQLIESVFVFDDRGIVDIRAADTFGNFVDSSASDHVKDWINQYKGRVTASCVIKDKNLYCLFFSDNTAAYCTVKDGKIVSILPQALSHTVERIFSTEDSTGAITTFFGDSDGFVHQLDKGRNFDGGSVDWTATLVYAHLGSPFTNKKFRYALLELDGSGYSEFYFAYLLGYGSAELSQPAEELYETGLRAGTARWDAVNWDEFTWDAIDVSPKEIPLDGTAENIAIILRGNESYYDKLRFSGLRIMYTPLRSKR